MLLFDQNISFRVVARILDRFPVSKHIKDLNLVDHKDSNIWRAAKEKHLTIVTFDSDFIDLANIKGHPPKIIWLRIGNTSTQGIADKLIEKSILIKAFIEEPKFQDIACLEIE
ncbi:MAG: DUF5615 family PIN-like protein [Bacteroidota bacterium]